jgi:hypothetical protein
MSLHLILKLAEEREKPELLAESRERRIRVAEESEKTEQEVQSYSCDRITLFFLLPSFSPSMELKRLSFSISGGPIGCPAIPDARTNAEIDGYDARVRSNCRNGRSGGLA